MKMLQAVIIYCLRVVIVGVDGVAHNKNLNPTANTVAFFAKETQKTAPARRWLGWR